MDNVKGATEIQTQFGSSDYESQSDRPEKCVDHKREDHRTATGIGDVDFLQKQIENNNEQLLRVNEWWKLILFFGT